MPKFQSRGRAVDEASCSKTVAKIPTWLGGSGETVWNLSWRRGILYLFEDLGHQDARRSGADDKYSHFSRSCWLHLHCNMGDA